jgi:hypothetical protein
MKMGSENGVRLAENGVRLALLHFNLFKYKNASLTLDLQVGK